MRVLPNALLIRDSLWLVAGFDPPTSGNRGVDMATAPRDPRLPLQKEPVAAHPPRNVILEGLEGAPYTLLEREFLSRGSKLPPRMLKQIIPSQ